MNQINFDVANTTLILLKLTLAMVFGGILGAERVIKRRPAGIKTHALVCLGATLVMITSEYIFNVYGTGDVARLGAQVISGVGFLGAGTIMVTGVNKVSGLTTAAGLWFSACLGLTIGIGYYTAAVLALFMTLIINFVLGKIDGYYKRHAYMGEFRIVLESGSDVADLIIGIKKLDATVLNLGDITAATRIVTLNISFARNIDHGQFIEDLHNIKGVVIAEEI